MAAVLAQVPKWKNEMSKINHTHSIPMNKSKLLIAH